MTWEDSDTVRQAFRRLCQLAALLTVIVSSAYGLLLYRIGMPDWQVTLMPVPFCVPLYWMQSPRRSYAVFNLGLALMVVLVIGMCGYATLKYGRSAGFHLTLLTVFPVIAVSGRIGVKVKWLLAVLSAVGLMALDHQADDTAALALLTPAASTIIRAVNLAIPALCTMGLALHYFRLAARQYGELAQLAMSDPLTGLLNRRELTERARRLIAETERGGEPFAAVICDLDHFKMINDRHGHEAGDAVLRRVGRNLASSVRSTDSAGRWGGEEFLLLLPQTDLQGAGELAHRLRARFAEQSAADGAAALKVTATLGVAGYRPGDTLEGVIARADAALYAGKAAGRNRVVVESAA